jgi:hypothetical protein
MRSITITVDNDFFLLFECSEMPPVSGVGGATEVEVDGGISDGTGEVGGVIEGEIGGVDCVDVFGVSM